MLKNLKEDLFKYEKDNNIYTNFGMVYHSMSEINELIDKIIKYINEMLYN